MFTRYFQNGNPDGSVVNPISDEEIEEQRSYSLLMDMSAYYYDENGNQIKDLPEFPVSIIQCFYRHTTFISGKLLVSALWRMITDCFSKKNMTIG